MSHERGVNFISYRVTVSIKGDFRINVYPHRILKRNVNVILAQEVFATLPEFYWDELNNRASCVIVITSESACETRGERTTLTL